MEGIWKEGRKGEGSIGKDVLDNTEKHKTGSTVISSSPTGLTGTELRQCTHKKLCIVLAFCCQAYCQNYRITKCIQDIR